MSETKISAVVIAKNEEKMLKGCLGSIAWVDRVIVIDSGSSDKTVIEAKKLGAKVYHHNFVNFADLRNYSLKKAKGDWLLYLDADERISRKLALEIQKTIVNPGSFSAFFAPRLNIFFGWPMRFGGWYPDYKPILFKKDCLEYWFGEIHESPKVKGKFGKFKNCLIHLSHRSLTQGFAKSVSWTEMEANLIYQARHPPVTIFHLFKVMTGEFLNRLIIKFGFLDGSVGILESIIQAFNKFLVYSQVWEKQQKKTGR